MVPHSGTRWYQPRQQASGTGSYSRNRRKTGRERPGPLPGVHPVERTIRTGQARWTAGSEVVRRAVADRLGRAPPGSGTRPSLPAPLPIYNGPRLLSGLPGDVEHGQRRDRSYFVNPGDFGGDPSLHLAKQRVGCVAPLFLFIRCHVGHAGTPLCWFRCDANGQLAVIVGRPRSGLRFEGVCSGADVLRRFLLRTVRTFGTECSLMLLQQFAVVAIAADLEVDPCFQPAVTPDPYQWCGASRGGRRKYRQ